MEGLTIKSPHFKRCRPANGTRSYVALSFKVLDDRNAVRQREELLCEAIRQDSLKRAKLIDEHLHVTNEEHTNSQFFRINAK